MLTITGEVRKVLDDQYQDRKQRQVQQAILIIEPENGRQNYEVYLSNKQLQGGAKDAWSKLQGKKCSVCVSLFVNHDYRFHKFNAVGSGMPMPTARSTQS